MTALADIADCRLGKMLDQQKNLGALRPYLRNTNVQWGRINLDDIKEMRIEDHERDKYAVLPGDLLICEGGEPGRCAVWREDREMYLQKALHRVRPRDGISADYIRWWFQNATSNGGLDDLFTGSTIKHLPARQLARVPIPVPSAAEQQRIAERLDDFEHSRAAAAIRLQSACAALDRFRSATLAAACSGRLTADWRDAHPDGDAEQLYRELIEEREKSKTQRATLPDEPGLTSAAQVELLPSSWRAVRLGDILDVGTGATPLRKKRAYYENGTIPWVTSGAVNAGKISSPTELITPLALEETNVKLFPPGTLLVAMYGEGQTRGRVAELAIESGTNQAVAAVLFAEATARLKPFIRLFFEDSYQRIRALSVGGVQPNLNLGMIKDTLLPLPPLEEQAEIVRRAATALTVADRLSSQIEQAAGALDRVSRATLAKAFRGELVPAEEVCAGGLEDMAEAPARG
jgi:type I restriction enzyme S subunit